ncbi:MAG: glycosyltransferase family 4 protein [Balneolales bacterium]
MKIAYIATGQIPSEAANLVNKLHMVNSFASKYDTLFVFLQNNLKYKGIRKYIEQQYNIRNRYKLWIIPSHFGFITFLIDWISLRLIKAFFKPDVIVTRSLNLASYAISMDMRVIFDMHRPKGTSKRDSQRALILEEKVFKSYHTVRIACTTQSGARLILNRYGEKIKNKVIVARNGAAMGKNTINKGSPSGIGMMNVGYFGQLYPGKGMEIISHLIKNHQDILFHVAGGPKKNEMQWSHQLKEAKNVIFHGYLDQNQLQKLREQCDVLLAPYQQEVVVAGGHSRPNTYSSPLKIFEYMASKRAIIASNNPEIREVLTHGIHALLAKSDSHQQWSECLLKLKQDKYLRDHLAVNAFQTFQSSYTWDKRADMFLDGLNIATINN